MKESIQFSYPAIKKFLIRLPCWKWTQEGQGKDRVACTSLDPHINTSVHNTLTWMHGHSSHQKTEQRSTDHNTHCQSVTSFSVQDAITPASSQNYYLGPNPFPSLTPTPRFVPQNRVGVVVEISAVYVTTGHCSFGHNVTQSIKSMIEKERCYITGCLYKLRFKSLH